MISGRDLEGGSGGMFQVVSWYSRELGVLIRTVEHNYIFL